MLPGFEDANDEDDAGDWRWDWMVSFIDVMQKC